MFDGAAIVAIGLADHDDAAQIEARCTQRGDGKQCVIDGAESGARNEEDGQRQLMH